ncbi:hypothetical protein [Haloarchaeobius baliensis]|uniref:hypothetical protein n=1 Tax=Haloarchaeobius baliensis TaxID=1670458 RepID=UPI003F881F10
MTDASVAVTQTRVERFAEKYLKAVGCSIEKRNEKWAITVPDDADTELPTGEIPVICGDPDRELDSDEELLHPESSFFHKLLEEASRRCPRGRLSIASESPEVSVPHWLETEGVRIDVVDFTPYYDRVAVVVLFRIGIETVSEYQEQHLEAVAIDSQSQKVLEQFEETFLAATSIDDETVESQIPGLDRSSVMQIIESASEAAVDRIRPRIGEVHEEASRSADAELEEYRQMKEAELAELDEKRESITTKIEEVSEAIQEGERDSRVDALKRRKELNEELEQVESKREDLREKRDKGFPQTQREIRERHALEVVSASMTVTKVEYESGEARFRIAGDRTSEMITVGYGAGVGITEEIHCDNCGESLSNSNPLSKFEEGLICEDCSTTSREES